MEIVYIFCEAKQIRVPLFGYDRQLYSFFISRGGKWDSSTNEFTLEKNINVERLCGDFWEKFVGVPMVLIKNQTSVPKVYGFMERQWNQTNFFNKPKMKFIINEKESPVAVPVPLPPLESDKFPKHWEIKLENEMRAAKYSRQARKSYNYYNRFLCHFLQKFPEEVQTGDIKQFLAAVEKGRDYSAATLNLALSAIKNVVRHFWSYNIRNKGII